MDNLYKVKQGKNSVSDGTKTSTIIATQGTGVVLRLFAINVSVTVPSSGGTGIVSLTDGGTAFWSCSGATTGSYNIYYGDPGYGLTQGNGLAMSCSGGTTDASAIASAVAICPGL